jgi:hypothetical protein
MSERHHIARIVMLRQENSEYSLAIGHTLKPAPSRCQSRCAIWRDRSISDGQGNLSTIFMVVKVNLAPLALTGGGAPGAAAFVAGKSGEGWSSTKLMRMGRDGITAKYEIREQGFPFAWCAVQGILRGKPAPSRADHPALEALFGGFHFLSNHANHAK